MGFKLFHFLYSILRIFSFFFYVRYLINKLNSIEVQMLVNYVHLATLVPSPPASNSATVAFRKQCLKKEIFFQILLESLRNIVSMLVYTANSRVECVDCSEGREGRSRSKLNKCQNKLYSDMSFSSLF